MKQIYIKILLILLIIIGAVTTLFWTQSKNQVLYNSISSTALKIKYLDEVLTMSARMSSFTGDLSWVKRYDTHAKELDKVLEKAKQERPILEQINTISDANNKLISMELKSFKLVKQNKLQEAQDLLSSTEYERNKDIYSKGIKNITSYLQKKNLKATEELSLNHDKTLYLIIIMLIVLAIFAIYVFLTLQKYYSQVLEKKNELQQLNENLEDKVKEEVSKNREKDLQLLEASKMSALSELIENIAHQWRQPLNTLSIQKEILVADLYEENITKEEIEKYDKGTDKQLQYLSNTINTFKRFLTSEKEPKNLILQEEVDVALNIMSSTLASNNVNLKERIDKQTPIHLTLIEGDLPQVLINIFNNSIDIFLEREVANPEIQLTIEQSKDKVQIVIKDNGGGIEKRILPKVFEPYTTTKHKARGTGLSLHICYKIITEKLLGNITAKNSEIGAEFIIELPLKVIT